MNTSRRRFLAFCAAFCALPVVPLLSSSPKRYGCVTVESWKTHLAMTGEYLRAYVNGVEVTYRSYEVNDRLGYAKVYCRDESGHSPWIDSGSCHVRPDNRKLVCRHVLYGDVVIVPGSE